MLKDWKKSYSTGRNTHIEKMLIVSINKPFRSKHKHWHPLPFPDDRSDTLSLKTPGVPIPPMPVPLGKLGAAGLESVGDGLAAIPKPGGPPKPSLFVSVCAARLFCQEKTGLASVLATSKIVFSSWHGRSWQCFRYSYYIITRVYT